MISKGLLLAALGGLSFVPAAVIAQRNSEVRLFAFVDDDVRRGVASIRP
jgi:hypothetical protein